MEKSLSCGLCYKTFFGGNLDFPKIKKLNNICSDDWTCTKMLKNLIFSYTTFKHCLYGLKWTILAVSDKGEISNISTKKVL